MQINFKKTGGFLDNLHLLMESHVPLGQLIFNIFKVTWDTYELHSNGYSVCSIKAVHII